jgi:hypothetical protein
MEGAPLLGTSPDEGTVAASRQAVGPLHSAVFLGDVPQLVALLSGPEIAGIDEPDRCGNSPLHLATLTRNVEAIRCECAHKSLTRLIAAGCGLTRAPVAPARPIFCWC